MLTEALLALLLASAGAAPAPSAAPAVVAQSTRPLPPPWAAAPAAAAPAPMTTNSSSSLLLPIDVDAVAAAERLLGSPPLTDAQRRGLYGDGLPYIPATLSTLLEAYARVRGVVNSMPETVAGAGHAPLALVYAPPEFKPAVAAPPPRHNKTHGGGKGVTATSVGADDPPVVSIPPDDVADDAPNYVGDDDLAASAAPSILAGLPRLLTWACGARCGVGVGDPVTRWRAPPRASTPVRPASNESLAYMTALELGALVRARKVSAVELVEVFTARLKR